MILDSYKQAQEERVQAFILACSFKSIHETVMASPRVYLRGPVNINEEESSYKPGTCLDKPARRKKRVLCFGKPGEKVFISFLTAGFYHPSLPVSKVARDWTCFTAQRVWSLWSNQSGQRYMLNSMCSIVTFGLLSLWNNQAHSGSKEKSTNGLVFSFQYTNQNKLKQNKSEVLTLKLWQLCSTAILALFQTATVSCPDYTAVCC